MNRKWKYLIIYSILAILLITAIDIIHSTFTDYFSIKRAFYKAAEVLPMLIGDVNDPERNYLKVREDRDEYAVKASVLEKNGTIDEIVNEAKDALLKAIEN